MIDFASFRLRSRFHQTGLVMLTGAAAAMMLMMLALTLQGCAAGDPQFTPEQPANFWLGLWHGMISWITLIVGIFDQGVAVYERNNNGGWYDFGFLLGATSIWGGGSSAGYHRSRRWRGDRGRADTVV